MEIEIKAKAVRIGSGEKIHLAIIDLSPVCNGRGLRSVRKVTGKIASGNLCDRCFRRIPDASAQAEMEIQIV